MALEASIERITVLSLTALAVGRACNGINCKRGREQSRQMPISVSRLQMVISHFPQSKGMSSSTRHSQPSKPAHEQPSHK